LESARVSCAGGRLNGDKLPVLDGDVAGLAIVSARDAGGAPRLMIVDLNGPGVTRESILTLLRDWQRANPDVELFLDYFGGCDPAYYVKHVPLIDTNQPEVAPAPGSLGRDNSGRRKVLAVSASKLQGIYPPY
jgi:hypothetical protein